MPRPTFTIFRLTAATLVALAASPLSAAEVDVKLLGGKEPLSGELAALGANVAVVTPQGRQAIPASEVLTVNFSPVVPAEKPAVWVELIDGSLLHAVQITSESGKTKLELIGGTKLDVPSRSLKSVRLKPQDADLARQWRAIGSGMPQGDVIVIRRTTQRTVEGDDSEPQTLTETSLDQLEGTVLGITPESIQFNFDGDVIPVKREKVEGVYFFAAVKRDLPPATCQLVEAGGSLWALKSIELRENGVAGVTTSNVSVVVPLDQVASIDFSAGNVVFLGDVEPDTQEVSSGLQLPGIQEKIERMSQPGQNRRFGAASLTLGGIKYDKGLGLANRTQVSYRVPEGFSYFRATVGVDDSVEQVSGMTLTILGDNKPLYTQEFGRDARGPVEIELNVANVRRLTIIVQPKEVLGTGELLSLCDARLTK